MSEGYADSIVSHWVMKHGQAVEERDEANRLLADCRASACADRERLLKLIWQYGDACQDYGYHTDGTEWQKAAAGRMGKLWVEINDLLSSPAPGGLVEQQEQGHAVEGQGKE